MNKCRGHRKKASEAQVRDAEASVRGRRRAVGNRVNVNGVGRAAPGLNLLGNLLGVGRGKHTGEASIAEVVRRESRSCETASERPTGARTRGPRRG